MDKAAAKLLLTYNPTYTKPPEPPSRVWEWSAVLAEPSYPHRGKEPEQQTSKAEI